MYYGHVGPEIGASLEDDYSELETKVIAEISNVSNVENDLYHSVFEVVLSTTIQWYFVNSSNILIILVEIILRCNVSLNTNILFDSYRQSTFVSFLIDNAVSVAACLSEIWSFLLTIEGILTNSLKRIKIIMSGLNSYIKQLILYIICVDLLIFVQIILPLL